MNNSFKTGTNKKKAISHIFSSRHTRSRDPDQTFLLQAESGSAHNINADPQPIKKSDQGFPRPKNASMPHDKIYTGKKEAGRKNNIIKTVLGIRNLMFLELLDPDPLVRCTDPAPDPSLFSHKC